MKIILIIEKSTYLKNLEIYKLNIGYLLNEIEENGP